MLHLSSERLAALADSEPTLLEAEHLSSCAVCARERAATRSLLMMARAEREQLGMPLTRWDSLAPELHRAGLVAAGALMSAPLSTIEARAAARATSMQRAMRWLQAAAVVLLVGGGAALGRLSAGASPLGFGPAEGPRTDVSTAAATRRRPPLAPGTSVSASDLRPDFASVEDALVALQRYELAYQRAAAYLADHDSTARVDDPDVYRTRLAALERTQRAMGEALREAPYDPVINGYYLTTLGQREATLRQIDNSLPNGYRIRSF
jgi:hypothetical protein